MPVRSRQGTIGPQPLPALTPPVGAIFTCYLYDYPRYRRCWFHRSQFRARLAEPER